MRRQLSLALAAALSLMFLVAASPAAAKEFGFQGGGDPFDGEPIVGMTMKGKDPEKPKRVTGFTITGFDWICGTARGPAELETVPLHLDTKVGTKGLKIGRNKEKDRWFDWEWEQKVGGTVFSRYRLLGGQHRKHANVWRGKVKIRHSEAGLDRGECTTNLDDNKGFIRWEARYVGTID